MGNNGGLKTVVEWLEAAPSGTLLHDIVGGRIGMGRLPDGFRNLEPAVVVNYPGGVPALAAPVMRGRYTLRLYAGSDNVDDLTDVFRGVFERLHNVQGQAESGGILLSYLVTYSISFDPDAGWPVGVASFEIATVEDQENGNH